MNQRRLRPPPVPPAVSVALLSVLLLASAVILRRSRQARLFRLQTRLDDAGVQGELRSEPEKTALRPAEYAPTPTEALRPDRAAMLTNIALMESMFPQGLPSMKSVSEQNMLQTSSTATQSKTVSQNVMGILKGRLLNETSLALDGEQFQCLNDRFNEHDFNEQGPGKQGPGEQGPAAVLQNVRGLAPAVLTPSASQVVRVSLFDEQSAAVVLQTVQTLLGDDHMLNAGDEAMIWGAFSTVQRQGQANFRRFTEHLQRSGDTLEQLLTEYRSEYQPMRASSLLHALLPTLFPDGLPDGFALRRAEVRREEGSEPSPVSPWLLLEEGEHDLAVQALLDALNWAPDLAPQASVLLKYHR